MSAKTTARQAFHECTLWVVSLAPYRWLCSQSQT